MLRYLIQRPVSVGMSFLALLLMGVAAAFQIPVGLLPEVDVPRALVQVRLPEAGARELENTIVRPLRNHLLQVRGLEDIRSQTRDGSALLELDFKFGTNANLALIEINEKLDQLMPLLPRELERPRVLKAAETDLPVFYLSVLPKDTQAIRPPELAELSQNTLKRRIEQLPEVAFADLSGFAEPVVLIRPRPYVFQSLHLDEDLLEKIFSQNNFRAGNFLLRSGAYEYNLRLLSELTSVDDIANLPLRIGRHTLRLQDIAEVRLESQPRRGLYLFNGREAVVFSIRKQAGARLFDLRTSFEALLEEFRRDYPQLEFHRSLDQTALFDLALTNLRDNLLYGLLGILAVTWLFFRNLRTTFWVAACIPLSLSATLLGLHLLDVSINVLSLAGLILGVGMMMDNAIVVLENISHKMRTGLPPMEACIEGANEILPPMLSSTLTTCAVFVPLVFLSGLAGALFFDQAASVSLALGSSVLVAWLLLPVAMLNTRRTATTLSADRSEANAEKVGYLTFYTRWVDACLRRKVWVVLAAAGLAGAGIFLLAGAPKTLFPPFQKDTLELKIDWNEQLSLQENRRRTTALLAAFQAEIAESNALLGEPQFLLETNDQAANEAALFLRLRSDEKQQFKEMQTALRHWFTVHFPRAQVRLEPAKNLFDQVFGGNQPALVLHLQAAQSQQAPSLQAVQPILDFLKGKNIPYTLPTQREQAVLLLDPEKLLRYGVTREQAHARLKTLLHSQFVGSIETGGKKLTVKLGMEDSPADFF